MKKSKYKILVLSDLKKSTSTALKSTVSLAKMIDAEVDFFYVKSASDIVERDNQLSAIRSINQDYTAINKKIKKIIQSVSENHQININYSFAFGNIKNEISNCIKEKQPDIIVLGKKKNSLLNLGGDKITELVLKTHNGAIMIAANENALQPNETFSLGILNNVEQSFNIEFSEDLLGHIQKPLRAFRIIEKPKPQTETSTSTKNETVEYVFEQSEKAMVNLSKYLSKSRVNLLFVDRAKKSTKNKSGVVDTNIKNAMNTINVSLLISGK